MVDDHLAQSKRIGLALSGGGLRATAFHLGVIQRIAEGRALEQVSFLSTVSGGSLAVGLIFALSQNQWPSSTRYIQDVIPSAEHVLTNRSVQRDYVLRLIRQPWLLLQGRAKVLARSLEEIWGINGRLSDLSTDPRWVINATTYESGKNWRFMPQRMGDYVVGYVPNPTIPIADAVAASAAFPGLVGPLVLRTADFSWSSYSDGELKPAPPPPVKRIHIWDGGVYDNLGVEALFKPGRENRYRDEFDFLIVSDASARLPERTSSLLGRPLRPVVIAMDQVRSLRARSLVDHLTRNPGSGAYLRIGSSAEYILEQSPHPKAWSTDTFLSSDAALAFAAVPTHLRRFTATEFRGLVRHGWEVAECVLASRASVLFG